MNSFDDLEFAFNDLPQKFTVTLDNTVYNMRIYYNRYSDSFYVDLFDENDVELVRGEKLVYGMPLWGDINDQRLPVKLIVPIDPDGVEDTISALNFPKKVKLSFVGEEATDDIALNDESQSLIDDDELADDADTEDDIDVDVNPYGNDPYIGSGEE
ncbi:phage baseplate plug protein [Lentilactobacillus sp. SPB1-3]|uniref:Uncharacterized protein n=1 Tax=Lentilactobacillus terminaliae TaxID=3003483 RepID=A0ACD5DD69_9LACO|nr:hypothetical protein [Lentilactobacillus sp. SPB1-3]MCZ0978119.1 hypothetical protein [Lentilactobacillus sp. SPB1-3]